eukprot:scaffold2778_cov36-Phaeocystis_antarctica.AAC.1
MSDVTRHHGVGVGRRAAHLSHQPQGGSIRARGIGRQVVAHRNRGVVVAGVDRMGRTHRERVVEPHRRRRRVRGRVRRHRARRRAVRCRHGRRCMRRRPARRHRRGRHPYQVRVQPRPRGAQRLHCRSHEACRRDVHLGDRDGWLLASPRGAAEAGVGEEGSRVSEGRQVDAQRVHRRSRLG